MQNMANKHPTRNFFSKCQSPLFIRPCLTLIFFIFPAFFAITCLAGHLPAAETESPLQITSVSWEKEYFVTDPVFDSRVFMCETGLENDRYFVLIHGAGAEASTIWKPLLPALGKNFHVLTFDLPGFGKSEKSNTNYNPERFSRFISWVVDTHTKGKIYLLGHSLGGALALDYTATHAEKVEKLILVDVAGILHRAALTKFYLAVDEPGPSESTISKLITTPFERPLQVLNNLTGNIVENLEKENTDEKVDVILSSKKMRENLLGGSPGVIAGMALLRENFTDTLHRVKPETLVIWGGRDKVAPLRTGKLLQAKLPRATLHVIDSGHVPMTEQTDLFLETLFAGLSRPYAQQPPPQFDNVNRTGSCQRQNYVVFSGEYERIVIEDCRYALLSNVTAGQVHITNSEAIIENSIIRNETAEVTPLTVRRSRLEITAASIAGDVAIYTSRSRLDLAGVDVHGKLSAVNAGDDSVLLFSVSTVKSPKMQSDMHGIVKLNAGDNL